MAEAQAAITNRYGVINDKTLSQVLKVTITQRVGDRSVAVVGYLGEGSSKEFQSNWESPFEGDTVGGQAQRLAGGAQALSQSQTNGGLTSVSGFNSKQIWSGNAPMTMNLTLEFKAISDPLNEVNRAIMELERMASPELNDYMMLGRTPQSVCVDVGRTNVYKDMLIESVSSELDATKTKDGLFLSNTVTLSLTARNVINRSKINETFRN